MFMKQRVVVTGLGALTPVGHDVPTTWEALLAGRSGIGRISRFDPSELNVQIAAEVKDFDPAAIFGHREARRNGEFTLFALEAARQAVADAGLALDDEGKRRAGVIVGTGIGGILALLDNYDMFLERGGRRVSPFMIPMMMPNAASGAVAIDQGLQGPNFSISSACATGSHAIGEAAMVIRRGQAEIMLCGGSEVATHPLAVAGFGNMGAHSTRNDDPQHACRPFDAERDGFVIGEGAGILVLETLEHAQQRGARIHAELLGYGASADAFHITAPDETGQGAALAMQAAIHDAGLAPEDVDYINAHGTSTPLNDRIETQAIRIVFGLHADQLAVNSTKSMTGHSMGAAGAIEAIVCVRSLETGWIHPTINYEYPDPECDLDYVPNQARRLDPRVALSNSFGFGGHNGCLIFRRWEGE
jgi:3-oxoacyl-[acyl-carrier-protein] synthase II